MGTRITDGSQLDRGGGARDTSTGGQPVCNSSPASAIQASRRATESIERTIAHRSSPFQQRAKPVQSRTSADQHIRRTRAGVSFQQKGAVTESWTVGRVTRMLAAAHGTLGPDLRLRRRQLQCLGEALSLPFTKILNLSATLSTDFVSSRVANFPFCAALYS